MEEISHNFLATFSETKVGRKYFELVENRDKFKSEQNTSNEGEIDLGKLNTLNQEISEMENSPEIKKYLDLKNQIRLVLDEGDHQTQKVA
ncbi:MAG: hypothetical protein R3B55_00320 [Candidatus Paceibacterota bacterium]